MTEAEKAEIVDIKIEDKATLIKLQKLREIQKEQGPHLCLASSKFFLGKAIGFIDSKTHLNTFLASRWANGKGQWALKSAWGKLDGEGDFNNRILPAVLTDPNTGVSNPNSRWRNLEYCHFWGNESFADSLLFGRVPLVATVNYLGGTGRDHYIAIIRSSNFRLWAIDPWGVTDWKSVVELPMDFSFSSPKKFKMNASGEHGRTLIPCAHPYFGYYRDKRTKNPIGLSSTV